MVEFLIAISQLKNIPGSDLTAGDVTEIVCAIEEIKEAINKHEKDHESGKFPARIG